MDWVARFFGKTDVFASYVQDYVISSDQANAMVKAASLLSCRIEPAEFAEFLKVCHGRSTLLFT